MKTGFSVVAVMPLNAGRGLTENLDRCSCALLCPETAQWSLTPRIKLTKLPEVKEKARCFWEMLRII